MDKQKKQIILVAVLGVVALGMGSYFVLIRERVDPNRGRTMTSGPVERRARKDTSTTEKQDTKKKRAAKKTTEEPKVAMERKTRERTEQKTEKRRASKRGAVEKVKKKEAKPAA